MCQYTLRCPVGRHKPGTQCKYAGANRRSRTSPTIPPSVRIISRASSPIGGPHEPPTPRTPTPPPGTPRGASQERTAVSALPGVGLFVIVLIALLIVGTDARELGRALALPLIAIPALCILPPVFFCTARNRDQMSRCRRRAGGFRRCGAPGHGRLNQPVTAPELFTLIALVATVTNLGLLLPLIASNA